MPAASQPSKNIPYLPGVDHLRGAAALLIVYYHGVQLFARHTRAQHGVAVPAWLRARDPFSALIIEGHTAVSLFLVLSGFILTFGGWPRGVRYRQFLTNRFLRTYPLYLFLIIVGTSVHSGSLDAAALLQLALGGANLPGAQSLGSFSWVSWTLAVEWQFYLLFPALLAVAIRSGLGKLGLLCALVVVSRALGYLAGADPVGSNYFHLLGRLDQLLLGMISGASYQRFGHRKLATLLAPSLILLFAGAYGFNRIGGWPAPAWYKVLTPLGEALVWSMLVLGYVAFAERLNLGAARWCRALSGAGTLSYSMYLWHFVLIDLQLRHNVVPFWLDNHDLNAALVTTATTLPLTLALSWLSYRAIEKPFMALRKPYLAGRPEPASGT